MEKDPIVKFDLSMLNVPRNKPRISNEHIVNNFTFAFIISINVCECTSVLVLRRKHKLNTTTLKYWNGCAMHTHGRIPTDSQVILNLAPFVRVVDDTLDPVSVFDLARVRRADAHSSARTKCFTPCFRPILLTTLNVSIITTSCFTISFNLSKTTSATSA